MSTPIPSPAEIDTTTEAGANPETLCANWRTGDQKSMNNPNSLEQPTAPTPVASGDWFGDFVACLQKRKAKLRAGCKMTVNTETFVTNVLLTIEIQVKPMKWLTMKMPDGRWYFPSASERDEMLKRLMSSNAEVSEGGTRDSRIKTAAQSRPSLH